MMLEISAQQQLLDANAMVGEPKPIERRFWTAREIKVLAKYFPIGGLAECLPHLPGRSASSIYQKARLEGLLSPATQKRRGVPRQRWSSNAQIDRLITETYQRARKPNDIARLAATVGRPKTWVRQRALKLGVAVPRFKEPPWTEAEIAIVSEIAHLNPKAIRAHLVRRGYERSETAISVKLKRLEVDRTDPDHYTGRGLASIMGVDDKTVSAWINKGWLKAQRRGTARVEAQGGDQWWIRRRDVARFIVENVGAINFCKIDKFWLVDLLTHEGRAIRRAEEAAA